jgi:hypothetical protein
MVTVVRPFVHLMFVELLLQRLRLRRTAAIAGKFVASNVKWKRFD